MDLLGIGNLASTIVNKIWPDKTVVEKADLEAQIAQAAQEFQLVQSQLDINKAEAASDSIFVAGWRPCIGWICGAAFAWTFVLQPFIVFFLELFHVQTSHLPNLDINNLTPVLMGMLGLGGMRTYEKIKGVAGKK